VIVVCEGGPLDGLVLPDPETDEMRIEVNVSRVDGLSQGVRLAPRIGRSLYRNTGYTDHDGRLVYEYDGIPA
jgi:hypothetical protein